MPRGPGPDRGARDRRRRVRRVEAATRLAAGASACPRHKCLPVRGAGDGQPDALQGPQLDAHLTRKLHCPRSTVPKSDSPQRSSFVDIDSDLIIDRTSQHVKGPVLNQLDLIAKTTKADIFVLMPKQPDIESASFNGNLETGMDSRLRCAIYGDMETMEHAKTRVLIMIDQIVSSDAPQLVPTSAQS